MNVVCQIKQKSLMISLSQLVHVAWVVFMYPLYLKNELVDANNNVKGVNLI